MQIKQIYKLLALLLYCNTTQAQHPVINRIIKKDPQLLVVPQKNENSYIVAIALDKNTRISYLVSRYGYVADSVSVSPADFRLIEEKKVSPFTHYQALTGKMVQLTETAKQQIRSSGTIDKNWEYAALLHHFVPELDTAKGAFQKLLLLNNFAKEFFISSYLVNHINTGSPEAERDPLTVHNPGSVQVIANSTFFYNRNLLANHQKAVLPDNAGFIIYYNSNNQATDSVPVSGYTRSLIKREKPDVFMLYRGWLEMQKIAVEDKSKLLAGIAEKPVLQQAVLNVLAENMEERAEIEKKLNKADRPDPASIAAMLNKQITDIPENQALLESLNMGYTTQFNRGTKKYELSDHRGNVMTVVTDRKLSVDAGTYHLQCYPCFPGIPCPPCEYVLNSPDPDGLTDYYTADVVNANDYFPFGMGMPDREFNDGNTHRYGLNGKEKDNEVKGEGNSIDFGARMYDPRLGRWLSPDPLKQIYTSISPYGFSGNNPLNIIDADGNILKDKQGNIIATADARVDENKNKRTIDYPDGSSLKISYKYVTIYTDEGNPVTAKMVTKAVVRMKGKGGKMIEKPASDFKSLDVSANCHGYAFAEGKVIIDDGESMKKIIEDDAYKYLGRDNSKDADVIVVYDKDAPTTDEELKQGKIDPDNWHHTAKKEKGKNTYTDKDDVYPKRSNLNPENVEEYDQDKGDQNTFFYKKEKNKGGKKIDVTSGTVVNGVRTVDKKDIEKIRQKAKATSSN